MKAVLLFGFAALVGMATARGAHSAAAASAAAPLAVVPICIPAGGHCTIGGKTPCCGGTACTPFLNRGAICLAD